jgi:hypothetical protein
MAGSKIDRIGHVTCGHFVLDRFRARPVILPASRPAFFVDADLRKAPYVLPIPQVLVPDESANTYILWIARD